MASSSDSGLHYGLLERQLSVNNDNSVIAARGCRDRHVWALTIFSTDAARCVQRNVPFLWHLKQRSFRGGMSGYRQPFAAAIEQEVVLNGLGASDETT